MSIVVQKYGGSSVATVEKVKRQARRIAWKRRQGFDVIVVVSAQGDTTDDLLESAAAVTALPDPREMDTLLSSGEQISMALMAMALIDLGCPAVSLTGPQAGIHTDRHHRAAKITEVKPDRIYKELKAGKVVVVAGFQGLAPSGDVATLGRGGSDATAIALAAALDAKDCQIFTDVDGVYTADPRIVPSAGRLDEIAYDELLELAAAGAQVMQLKSVEFAKQYGVEFEVLSSQAALPEDGGREEGTKVVQNLSPGNHRIVSGVAVDSKVARLSLLSLPDQPGVAARLFSALAKAKVNVDCIVQSGGPGSTTADISFTVTRDDLDLALEVCREVMAHFPGAQLVYDVDVAKVSVVGAGLASNYGIASGMFTALSERGINIELITGSEIKISCLVRAAHAVEAVRAVHEKFGLGKDGSNGSISDHTG